MYIEAIGVIEATMYVEFADSKLDSPELRHELWQRMQLVKQFKGRFEQIVRQGDKARTTLEMLINKGRQITGLR